MDAKEAKRIVTDVMLVPELSTTQLRNLANVQVWLMGSPVIDEPTPPWVKYAVKLTKLAMCGIIYHALALKLTGQFGAAAHLKRAVNITENLADRFLYNKETVDNDD
jgi:hypothetical protein